MLAIDGISHIDLSVRDVEASEVWYSNLFDARLVFHGRNDALGFEYRYLMLPTSGDGILLGLIQHDAKDGYFEATRPGLDHLAFAVSDRPTLESWLRRLDELGLEHSGIVEQTTGDALPVRSPDGVQLEFYVAASTLPWSS